MLTVIHADSLERGDRDRQLHALRQRHVDLHRVRRRRPPLPRRRAGRHDRRQRRRRRAGRVLPVHGLEGLVLRRHARARPARRSTSTRARRRSRRAGSRAGRAASSSPSRGTRTDGDDREALQLRAAAAREGARLPLVERPGRHRAARRRAGRGRLLVGPRRQALPRLLVAAGQHQHRPPAPEGGRRRSRSRPTCCAPSRRSTPTPSAAELAAMVAELAPGDIDMAFFTNGGAEANENAMRMARIYTGRHKVHGHVPLVPRRHAAARSSLTGDPRRWAAEPGMAGVVHFCGPVPLPLVVQRHDRGRGVRARARAPRGDPACTRAPSTVAGIILESVVGTNGILVPPDGYLQGRPRAVHQARHRDDLRRGDGGVRPHRQVVRVQPLGRRARPDLAAPRASTPATCRSARC